MSSSAEPTPAVDLQLKSQLLLSAIRGGGGESSESISASQLEREQLEKNNSQVNESKSLALMKLLNIKRQ